MIAEPNMQMNEIKALLEQLLSEKRLEKEFYSTDEVATLLNRKPYTVREWCREGRVKAIKRECGRGKVPPWKIHRSEVMYVQEHGLRPFRKATTLE